jgi:hypothetical protein
MQIKEHNLKQFSNGFYNGKKVGLFGNLGKMEKFPYPKNI